MLFKPMPTAPYSYLCMEAQLVITTPKTPNFVTFLIFQVFAKRGNYPTTAERSNKYTCKSCAVFCSVNLKALQSNDCRQQLQSLCWTSCSSDTSRRRHSHPLQTVNGHNKQNNLEHTAGRQSPARGRQDSSGIHGNPTGWRLCCGVPAGMKTGFFGTGNKSVELKWEYSSIWLLQCTSSNEPIHSQLLSNAKTCYDFADMDRILSSVNHFGAKFTHFFVTAQMSPYSINSSNRLR